MILIPIYGIHRKIDAKKFNIKLVQENVLILDYRDFGMSF